ncbi:MAG: ABC transporter permease subunit [Vicinamibacterales bacterium]
MLASWAGLALVAPVLTAHGVNQQYRRLVLAPPMWPHVTGTTGGLSRPFVYGLVSTDPLTRSFAADHSSAKPIVVFRGGRLLDVEGADRDAPWLPLGSDSLGRDVLTRLAHGARMSLAVACCAGLGALVLGFAIGGAAALAGGVVDIALMRATEFVLVVPWLYVVAILRAMLPLALPASTVFAVLSVILASVAWPTIARGVRGVVHAELAKPYASAVEAIGGGPWRLARHVIPAASAFAASQMVLLLPSLLLAEATLSFVGWGFPSDAPSWGTLLQDATNLSTFVDSPWLLSPVVGMTTVTIAVHLVADDGDSPSASLW